jgi:hypothetical protein
MLLILRSLDPAGYPPDPGRQSPGCRQAEAGTKSNAATVRYIRGSALRVRQRATLDVSRCGHWSSLVLFGGFYQKQGIRNLIESRHSMFLSKQYF